MSTEPTILELGRNFGYGKLLNSTMSGFQLFWQADQIATTQASEFFILAGLVGKPMIDLTKYEYSWVTAYQSFGQCVAADIETTKVQMNHALMHPASGWIHPSMSESEIDQRIARYCELAMRLREPFKMVSTQTLIGKTQHIKPWDIQEQSKSGPRPYRE